MLIAPIEILQTAVLGAWSFNTYKFSAAILKQIIIKSASNDTTFYFTITDEKNNIVYYNDIVATGVLRQECEIPLYGIYTLAVSLSSANEAYTGRLMVQEGY